MTPVAQLTLSVTYFPVPTIIRNLIVVLFLLNGIVRLYNLAVTLLVFSLFQSVLFLILTTRTIKILFILTV